MDANSVLIDALDSYSLNLGDYKGDTAAIANAISKCKDYLSHNTVTTDWVKRNWGNRLNIIFYPLIYSYLKRFLISSIELKTWKSVPFRIRSTTRFCLSVNGSL